MDGKADAIAEEDDAVDRAIGSSEAEDRIVFATDDDGALIDEILGCRRREIEERQPVVADVVGVCSRQL